VFTHDSIGLGEDGTTHQPVEQLASLRAMPGLTVIRPAGANETAQAWVAALQRPGPTAPVRSGQGLPVLDPDVVDVRGAVVAPGEDCALVATGSEVEIALAARGACAGGVAAVVRAVLRTPRGRTRCRAAAWDAAGRGGGSEHVRLGRLVVVGARWIGCPWNARSGRRWAASTETCMPITWSSCTWE
jgi:hypothetical protein